MTIHRTIDSGRLELPPEVIGQLMPMFVWLDPRGLIRAIGPTMEKVIGAAAVGSRFEQHFKLGRAWSRREVGAGEVGASQGRRLHVSLLRHPDISLRGRAVEIGANGADGVLLNLTFGIHIADAVRIFGLTEADFAPSDLAIELLYLREAKAAVLGELKALTGRLEEARRSAMSQALTDPLTGLANRRAFDLALGKAITGLAHGGGDFALAHLDLDHFKAVNDTLGHAAGDHVLGCAAQILREETRRGDVVARVGGDEFVLLLRGALQPERLCALGARIIARLEAPIAVEGAICKISGSIGISVSSDYTSYDAETMLADADAALYESKRNGRGRCMLVRDLKPTLGAVIEG